MDSHVLSACALRTGKSARPRPYAPSAANAACDTVCLVKPSALKRGGLGQWAMIPK
jgi:hypothetical protein